MVIELIHLGCHWHARKYSSFLPDSSSALLVTKIVSVCLFRTTEVALFGTWKRIRSPCWALLALSGNTYKLNRALLRKQIWVVNSAKRRTYIGQFGLVQSILASGGSKIDTRSPKIQNTFFIDICWSQRGGSAMCNLSFLMNHLLDSWPSSLSKSFLKAPTANFANHSWHGPVHYRLSGKVVQENMGLPGTGKPGQWLRDICGRQAPMHSFPKEDFLQFPLSMFSVCIWTC